MVSEEEKGGVWEEEKEKKRFKNQNANLRRQLATFLLYRIAFFYILADVANMTVKIAFQPFCFGKANSKSFSFTYFFRESTAGKI